MKGGEGRGGKKGREEWKRKGWRVGGGRQQTYSITNSKPLMAAILIGSHLSKRTLTKNLLRFPPILSKTV